jgi:hypothetical protein
MLKNNEFEPNQVLMLESKRPESKPLHIKEAADKFTNFSIQYLSELGQPLFNVDYNGEVNRLSSKGREDSNWKGWY